MARWRALALIAVVLAAGGLASVARADGDPASDYLLSRQVFLPSTATSAAPSASGLLAAVQAANTAGFSIRVAVIASDYDLGSITALWGRPRLYARFLGIELSLVYRQRLLVVMPDGFGFDWPGHPTAPIYRALAGLPIAGNPDALLASAQAAVRRLAAADGVSLAQAKTPARLAAAAGTEHKAAASGIGTAGTIGIASAVLALLAMIGMGLVGALRRGSGASGAVYRRAATAGAFRRLGGSAGASGRRRRRDSPAGRSAPADPQPQPAASRRRWVLPGFAAMCVAAVAIPVLVVSLLRHPSAAASTPAGSVVTPPPFSWPAGRRSAPHFVLRDQAGRPVSIDAYRGRPVIVTFIDPLCRNLCPLEAQVLNQAVNRLPAAQRPVIIAVSVDVYTNADARANLLEDVRKWQLVPQWRWAVGSPAQLAAVWRRYQVGVLVTTKRIAGTTIHYVTHTEAAYIVDASGHERALFMWPFYPQDVERVLAEIGGASGSVT